MNLTGEEETLCKTLKRKIVSYWIWRRNGKIEKEEDVQVAALSDWEDDFLIHKNRDTK